MIDIKPGMCFYQKQGSGNTGRKFHVVCILEEEPEQPVVFKYFGRYRRWWHYQAEALDYFKQHFEDGLYYTKD